MTNKVLFLSHIHEERDLALMFKTELEKEFSGFVDVFVSSDGFSIPAGSNFLKRIEEGLVTCIGALYLISPKSVKRSWISFELGAVWVRNAMSLRSGNPEIPTMPVCHSGMNPSDLPAPLSNLNAVAAGQSSQLEYAFRSLQIAVGGKGSLKTDFDELAGRVITFERVYTLGAGVVCLFTTIPYNIAATIEYCEGLSNKGDILLEFGFVGTPEIAVFRGLEANELNGHIKVDVKNSGIASTPGGAKNGGNVEITMGVPLILQFKTELLAAAVKATG